MVFANPVLIAVVVMLVLCLLKVNVMISLIVSAMVGGMVAGMDILTTMSTLISGMAGKNNVALSYILLGALATAIAYTGIVKILCYRLMNVFGDKRVLTAFIIAGVASLSQNVIPVHISFIPILIPPLLYIFNKMQLDRRAVALALTFGLKAPYLFIPFGFGAIFQGIVATNMTNSGLEISESVLWQSMAIPAFGMLVGLIIGVLFLYQKPRSYENRQIELEEIKPEDLVMTGKHWLTIVSIVIAFGVQSVFRIMGNMGIIEGPVGMGLHIGAVAALLFMFVTGVIPFKDMDDSVKGGVRLMGVISFVMLAAGGFAGVMNATGGVPELVDAFVYISGTGQFALAVTMMLIGTIVTMGIGTSFGTVPIIAPIFVPLGLAGGFSALAIACLIGTAAAIGDAGSPASDSTLGPTAGLDADGQHNHIYDTCVPTFVFFNIPLILFGIAGALIL